MLTNTYYHSQFNPLSHSQPIQLVQHPQQHLGPNKTIKIQSDMEYTQMKLEVPVIITSNYGFDQNNNSEQSSRLMDDMLLCRSYCTSSKLNSCLTIDCRLAQSEPAPPCLSSASSTTSTSSSSTSLNLCDSDTKPNDHLKTVYSQKKNNFLFKNVKKNAKANAPSTSSSNECLSSDEGYVGSYSEKYDLNKCKQNQSAASSSARSQEDSVHIQIPALFDHDDEPSTDLHWQQLAGPHELDVCEKCFPKLDANVLSSHTYVLYDELTASFSLESLMDIQQLCDKILNDRLSAEQAHESEMAGSNWRKVLLKRQQNAAQEGELFVEDECDLNAYLNEIDMNVNYSQLDQVYLNSWAHNSDLDQCLKFSSSKMAFNVRKYHEYLLGEQHAPKKNSPFANIQVDSIAEFVPVSDTGEPYAYQDNFDVDTHEYEFGEEYAADEAEYTMVQGDELYNFLIDTTVTGAHDLDDDNVDYEDYEDQLYIDSLSEDEAISLLRNESEIYALQMSQAAKYGLLDDSVQQQQAEHSVKKTRFDSGHTDDLSKADIFDSVFNYEEHFDAEHFDYNDGCAANSSVSASLRNSLLNLRKSRRHLSRLLDQNSKMMSSSCSTAASSASSSLSTSHMGLYKQHIANQSKKPCMYMLTEGRCLRADCRFVHDFKTITCKYWLEGECLKGESCEFLHEIVESEKSGAKSLSKKAKKEAKAKKDFKLDTEEFPALGLCGDRPKQASPKAKSQLMASVVKKSSAHKKENNAAKVAKDEKKSGKQKTEHKARVPKNASTPVIQITIKANKQAKKSSANSCGTSLTSSGSSSATSSRANSKIRVKK